MLTAYVTDIKTEIFFLQKKQKKKAPANKIAASKE
jgi:hypothetical protein